jgi:hypothetical protein
MSEEGKRVGIRNCEGFAIGKTLELTTNGPFHQRDTMEGLKKLVPQSTANECIDNTGSVNDEGYSQGYVDGQRDYFGLNGHSYDPSLQGKHTIEFRTGYMDGYNAGWSDAQAGKNLNPC